MPSTSPEFDPRAAIDHTTVQVRRAILQDDAESLDWLVRRFSPFLLFHARRRLTPPFDRLCEPEDVVQEVWRALLPRLQDLEPRSGRYTPVLLQFMSTVLMNLVRRVSAAHASGRSRVEFESGDLVEDRKTTDAHLRLERDEGWRLIEEALDALSEREREIFALRGLEGIANVEVARRLGMEPNTVSVTWRRLLRRLRSQLPGSILDEMD